MILSRCGCSAALGRHAAFLEHAQLLRDLVEFVARIGQRFFLPGAAVQQLLQAFVGGARFQAFQFGLAGFQAFRHLGFTCALAVAILRRNSSILLRWDFSANCTSCAVRSRSRKLRARRPGAVPFAGIRSGHLRARPAGCRVPYRAARTSPRTPSWPALLLFLRRDFGQVGFDLVAALVEARFDLGQLDHVQLQRMHRLLQALQLGAVFGQAARQLGHGGIGAHRTGARFVGQHLLRAQLLGDVLDFLLASSMPSCSESAA
jgi:hypothetical protein